MMNTMTQISAILPALLQEKDRRCCERSSTFEESKMRGWANFPFVICRSTFA